MAGSRERSGNVRQDSVINRLPGALDHKWDWQRQGRCRGMDSSVFYSPDGERGNEKKMREAGAKTICNPCPVKSECLDFALQTEELYGVWGGTTEGERRVILKRGDKSPS